MSEADNMALVRRFIEQGYPGLVHGNLDVLHQYFADNYYDHTPLHPEHPGVQGVKEVALDIGQAAPDYREEVLHIAADGDLVFVHRRATFTHQEQSQVTKHVSNVEPTGEEGTTSGISLFRIENGKFVEGWHYHNVLEYAMAQSQGGAATGSS
jgi:predicted SnoaL-like aldol condensation-catalyzing enzyme